MRYCYDSEFLEDGQTIALISIGIVCEDGREYYAVNSDMPIGRILKHDWLMTNVVPHLPGTKADRLPLNQGWSWALDLRHAAVKPHWVIANEVREFLLSPTISGVAGQQKWPPETGGATFTEVPGDPKIELWANFGAYDYVMLAQLWGPMAGLPAGLPFFTHEIQQLLERDDISERLDKFLAELPAQTHEHNALHDARWNMAVLRKARVVQPRYAAGGNVVTGQRTWGEWVEDDLELRSFSGTDVPPGDVGAR